MISTIDMMQNCRNMYLQVQQTPKPEAQLPALTPPLLEHSSLKKKSPFLKIKN